MTILNANNLINDSIEITRSSIKKRLGTHFERIRDFFSEAFELIDASIGGANVFVVFIARRCFVLACIFLRLFFSNSENYIEKQNRVFSDGGLRILAKRLAREFFKDNGYRCKIFIFDDILIHGRALGGLLSGIEDIFAQEYLFLRKLNPDYGRDYTRTELYDIFLSFVYVKNAYMNIQPNLLRDRYKSRLCSKNNQSIPREWRKASNSMANLIFNSTIPNAAFVPGILFNNSNFFNKDIIRHKFFEQMHKNNVDTIQNWKYIKNEYKGREMDVYLDAVPSYRDVYSVFSIRCTEHYIMPFVFLPMLDEKKYDYLEKTIIVKLDGRGYKDALKLYRFFSELKRVKELSGIYAELITMVLSISVLQSFLNSIRCDEKNLMGEFSVTEFLDAYTSMPIIMSNYAHEHVIESLMAFLLNPNQRPLFTIEDVRDLIVTLTYKKSLTNINNHMPQLLNADEQNRIIENLENVAFNYGIKSEKEAYRLSTDAFAPSYDSVEYFYFPMNNNLERFIESVYKTDSEWMSTHVSIYYVFSYVLQMMDYGSLSLTTGSNRKKSYIQCLKSGEQSLNARAYKYALELPLLKEIEKRCIRMGRAVSSSFENELKYFNNLSLYYIEEKNSLLLNDICKKMRNPLVQIDVIRFVEYLSETGQQCDDYMFATEEVLENMPEYKMNLSNYENECKEFYYRVIY